MTEKMTDQSDEKSCGCEPKMPSRRNFLRTVAVTAASLVVLPSTLASADPIQITWVDLGDQDEPTAAWTKYTLPDAFNGETIFIRKVVPVAGSVNMSPIYQAVSARCTHRHCVVGLQSDSTFLCPCHGATFDSNAYPTGGPAHAALPPLLCQWSASKTAATKGRLLVEAPNAGTSTPPQQ